MAVIALKVLDAEDQTVMPLRLSGVYSKVPKFPNWNFSQSRHQDRVPAWAEA